MKKIIALLLSFVVMVSVFTVASADDISSVTYYMEYHEDGTAELIFQAGDLSAFDFGVIYNPDEVTISQYDYSEEFYDIATDEAYTSIYVKNDKAVDNVGNSTYVVFTGAVMDVEDGGSINFADRNLASVVFSDISEGDEVAVVIGTAQVEDVKNARLIGAVDLYKKMEIGTSSILDGAIAESEDEADKTEANMTWVYGVVFGVIIVAAVILVLVSKKNKLDVSVKEIVREEDDEDEE